MQTSLEKKLDAEVQKQCQGKLCFNCWRPATAGHHRVRRSNIIHRWDMRNIIPVCPVCHHEIHFGDLEEPEIEFEVENEHDYYVKHTTYKKEFINMKAKEFGIKL